MDAFVKQGGTYETLRRQLEGSGLLLENMIGFASWFADDPSKRKEGLNQMRHDMECQRERRTNWQNKVK